MKQHPSEAARLSGIYLVTPDAQRSFDAVLGTVKQSLEAGVRAVQYRDKTAGEAQRRERASELAVITRAAGALLIVNDNIDVAISAGADGVHLGRDDADIAEARRRLPHQLIGVSCYNELEYARLPIAAGADAIAFGSMFASRTKPAAVRAPLSLLTAARAAWPRQRIIAIGGINVDNVAEIAAAGAHAAAVIDAIFGAKDAARAARELVRRFDEGQRRSHP
ncbi:MAG TPA: thiamine phosphate synthase [Burkholderiaceae bacterium]|nr:thiamine phosphate synthase [Burkholderiaceae bacterium]